MERTNSTTDALNLCNACDAPIDTPNAAGYCDEHLSEVAIEGTTYQAKSKRRCPGSSQHGVERLDRNGLPSGYPFCPVCGKEFGAQGRKHRWNQGNSWTAIPSHFVEVAK